jgi:hypothetical protein
MHRHHVLVSQAGSQARFLLETSTELRVVRELR